MITLVNFYGNKGRMN